MSKIMLLSDWFLEYVTTLYQLRRLRSMEWNCRIISMWRTGRDFKEWVVAGIVLA